MTTPNGLSFESLTDDQRDRMADLYVEMGKVYEEAGLVELVKITAWQAAWFRNTKSKVVTS